MARRTLAWLAVLLVIAFLVPGCSKQTEADVQTSVQQTDEDTAQSADVRKTVLYFRDASGYLAPVMRKLPVEEGIAKAALKCLVAGTDQDEKLAALGVAAPVPAGATFDLDIAEGKATVDIRQGEKCKDKVSEQAMVGAVVNTLLGFATVETVAVRIDGQTVSTLPNGATVAESYAEPVLNVEPVGAPDTLDGKLELCFANSTGKLLVPVYRVAGDDVNLANAIAEMAAPAEGTGLTSILPPGCEVLSAKLGDDGVATLEFSSEFSSVSDSPALEAMTLRSLNVVCEQFSGFKTMKILVNGEAFEPTVSTVAGQGSTGDDYLNYYD